MHEHLFKHFNSMIYNGFLHNDSITLIDKTDGQNPKKRDEYWRRTSKPTRPLDLMLKTVSDQPHIAKNVAYGLPFYGPVWILVWQGPFLDQEFGHDFLGLFGNTFRQGFVSCGSISYQLFVFSSVWCKFLLRGVSEYVLVFVTFLLLLIMVSWGRRGRVQFWQSCMLMACSFTNNEILCALTGLLSVGECISSKGNGQPLLLLEMNFTMDIRYFTSSFHQVFMLQ